MEKKMMVMKKKEWVAPQCKVYGDVEGLTLAGPGNGQQHGGGHGPGPGGGVGPSCCKKPGCSDCPRAFS